MSAVVRLATASDREAAVALYAALHRAHEALDARYRLADDVLDRWAASFRDWVRSPSTDAVWLAYADLRFAEADYGPAVGLLTAHLYETAPTFQPHRLVWIDDLYVAPEARGAGLAGRLVEAAAAWGRAHGAVELRAGVLAANADARTFWAHSGATDFSVTVARPLLP